VRLSDRRGAVAAAAATALAAGALALAGPAGATVAAPARAAAGAIRYSFTTLDNQADPTFNQLLGINSDGVIAGYFGSGLTGHPNKGYLLSPPYGQADYASENFPGSVQTQVTGLNNLGDTSGFWVSGNGTNRGFVEWNGVFASYTDPATPKVKGAVNQLLGVNNAGVAVGFYNDSKGNAHPYKVNQATSRFTAIKVPDAVSATAAGINNAGDIVGFFTDHSGATSSFLLTPAGELVTYQFPGGSDTQAFGISSSDQIVGSYVDSSHVAHGFVLDDPLGPRSSWQSIDDPNGVGSTVVNGLDSHGDLVGFYTDKAGNTDGFLAVPNVRTVKNLTLTPMPDASVRLGHSGGDLTAAVTGFGFTPGSSHTAGLESKSGSVLAVFSTLTANGVGQVAATLDSTFTGKIPAGARFGLLNGLISGGKVAQEPIAATGPLSGTGGGKAIKLITLAVSSSGTDYGTPQGHATIVYSPSAHSLTVTVKATGVTPGLHAAHVHSGSCQSQGPVVYMIPDFRASLQGKVSQTHVVTGVTGPIPPAGWYLNLHLGNSNNILTSGGQPTIYFRPLLCASIPG